MDLSILYFKGSHVGILNFYIEQTVQNLMKCCIMFSKEGIQFLISCKHCAVIRFNMALITLDLQVLIIANIGAICSHFFFSLNPHGNFMSEPV